MKKKPILFSMLLLSIISCSDDKKKSKEDYNHFLISEITRISDEKEYKENYSYKENKILDCDGSKKYYYQADKITKIELINSNNEIIKTIEYKYLNNRVDYYTTVEYGMVFKTKYTYEENGDVLYDTFQLYESGEEEELDNYGTYTFKNGNLIKLEEFLDGTETVTEYEYDNQKNPWKNVLGLNLLLDQKPSVNNVVKEKFNEIDGYSGNTTYSYKYNSDGYPVEKKAIYEDGNVIFLEKFKY